MPAPAAAVIISNSSRRMFRLPSGKYLPRFRSADLEFTGIVKREGCVSCPTADGGGYSRVQCQSLNQQFILSSGSGVAADPYVCSKINFAGGTICVTKWNGGHAGLGTPDPTCCHPDDQVKDTLTYLEIWFDLKRDVMVVTAFSWANSSRVYFFWGEIGLCEFAADYPTAALSNQILTGDTCFELPGDAPGYSVDDPFYDFYVAGRIVTTLGHGGTAEVTLSCESREGVGGATCTPCNDPYVCPTSTSYGSGGSGSSSSSSSSLPPCTRAGGRCWWPFGAGCDSTPGFEIDWFLQDPCSDPICPGFDGFNAPLPEPLGPAEWTQTAHEGCETVQCRWIYSNEPPTVAEIGLPSGGCPACD